MCTMMGRFEEPVQGYFKVAALLEARLFFREGKKDYTRPMPATRRWRASEGSIGSAAQRLQAVWWDGATGNRLEGMFLGDSDEEVCGERIRHTKIQKDGAGQKVCSMSGGLMLAVE